MFCKGLSERRSASPLTRWVARPLTASSRNLLSFGSRQAVIRAVVSTHSASRVRAARNRRTSSSSTYFRNSLRPRTSLSSASTANDSRTFPWSRARSKARRGTESARSSALMRTLVSKTKRKLRALQQRLQGFGRQPARAGFAARVVHDLAERRRWGGHEVPQPEAQQRLHLLLFLGGGGLLGGGGPRVRRERG